MIPVVRYEISIVLVPIFDLADDDKSVAAAGSYRWFAADKGSA